MDASQRLPYILSLVKWISVVQDHGSVSQLQTESHGTDKGVLSSKKKKKAISAVKTVICGHISYSIHIINYLKN